MPWLSGIEIKNSIRIVLIKSVNHFSNGGYNIASASDFETPFRFDFTSSKCGVRTWISGKIPNIFGVRSIIFSSGKKDACVPIIMDNYCFSVLDVQNKIFRNVISCLP